MKLAFAAPALPSVTVTSPTESVPGCGARNSHVRESYWFWLPSFTTSWNRKTCGVAIAGGAVKEGVADVAADGSRWLGRATEVHANVNAVPSGSLLPEPFNCTTVLPAARLVRAQPGPPARRLPTGVSTTRISAETDAIGTRGTDRIDGKANPGEVNRAGRARRCWCRHWPTSQRRPASRSC